MGDRCDLAFLDPVEKHLDTFAIGVARRRFNVLGVDEAFLQRI